VAYRDEREIVTKKLPPLVGVLFFVLLLLGFFVGTGSPSASSNGAKVLAHYEAHRNGTRVSGVLTVLAVVAGVIFYGMLRDYLRRHQSSRGWTATAFGGALLFGASGALSAGLDWALTDSPMHTTPAAAQALNLVSNDMTYALMLAGIAILFICFGSAILKSALLPAWLGWIAFPLAICALIPPIGFVAFIGAGIWTLIVAISLWLRLSDETAVVAPTPSAAI
jgi:Domain of unknown function (DUF4386)